MLDRPSPGEFVDAEPDFSGMGARLVGGFLFTLLSFLAACCASVLDDSFIRIWFVCAAAMIGLVALICFVWAVVEA